MNKQTSSKKKIQALELNDQTELVFTLASEAMQSFPWFASQMSKIPHLMESVLQGKPLLNTFVEHYSVSKSTIQRCRFYTEPFTLNDSNGFSEYLQNLDQLPIDYLPKQHSVQDQTVCFDVILPLNQLAKTLDCAPKKLAKPFLSGWDQGVEKLKQQTATELDFNLINNMMQACFQYGVLPVLNQEKSNTQEPTKEWYQLWFGHLSLKQLLLNAKKWDEQSTHFSAKRMNLSNHQTVLQWSKIVNYTVKIDDYYIEELHSQSQLDMEGYALNFCISSYAAKCLLENSFIFSIRDRAGKPFSTFEVSYTNNQFKVLQHQTYDSNEPSQDEQRVCDTFVQTILAKISKKQINLIAKEKIKIGQKLRDYLPDANTSENMFNDQEKGQLAELVSFLHPKQAQKSGLKNYLLQNAPHLLKGNVDKAIRLVDCLSQKQNRFSHNGKTYRTSSLKKADGTILCFIHDATKNYTQSYYGTVFIKNNKLEYRITNKSPRTKHADSIHLQLKQLIIKYQSYLND